MAAVAPALRFEDARHPGECVGTPTGGDATAMAREEDAMAPAVTLRHGDGTLRHGGGGAEAAAAARGAAAAARSAAAAAGAAAQNAADAPGQAHAARRE